MLQIFGLDMHICIMAVYFSPDVRGTPNKWYDSIIIIIE